jgi:opacity protein-like surface antigen
MKRFALAALAMAALSVQAQETAPAEDDGGQWRLLAGGAFSDFDGTAATVAGVGPVAIDDSQIGFTVGAQYKFNSWIGIEGAYLNTGDFSTDATPGSSSTKVELSYSGFSIAGLLYLPLPGDEIDFFAKLGFFDLDRDLAVDSALGASGGEDGAVYGLGAAIGVSDELGIRAGFDVYDVEAADLFVVTLGVEYRF